MKGFKDFLLRGNIVELAVAVIMAGAFGAIVNAFAKDFIGGIIAKVGGVEGIDKLAIGDTPIVYGTTITAAINFVIIAFFVYFLVVVPSEKLMKKEEEEDDTPADVAVLEEIRDLLKKN